MDTIPEVQIADDEQSLLFNPQEMLLFKKINRRVRRSITERPFRCQACSSEKAHEFSVSKSDATRTKLKLYLCDKCARIAWEMPLYNSTEEYTRGIKSHPRSRRK